ncbi:unnamed protein product [Anisakis simplex]|uniref:Uncharacterized protein n=1 Tax=Anisakis simplex TaxID=6269 RepID=A0A0M3JU83_ANISI|nr:unnamed protein product [Anisakis simplex]
MSPIEFLQTRIFDYGHYWAIHPANFEDFVKGDFRRRRAQRKVRRHMGLSVNEDECSDDSPITSPAPFSVESILQPDKTPRWLAPVIPNVVPIAFPFHLFTAHY